MDNTVTLDGNRLTLTHTFVPPELRGRGIATFLEWTGGNALQETVTVNVTADGYIELGLTDVNASPDVTQMMDLFTECGISLEDLGNIGADLGAGTT